MVYKKSFGGFCPFSCILLHANKRKNDEESIYLKKYFIILAIPILNNF